MAFAAPQFIITGIDRHTRQPAFEVAAAERTDVAEGVDHRLLQGVLGNTFIVDDPQGYAIQHVLVGQNERIERIPVTALC